MANNQLKLFPETKQLAKSREQLNARRRELYKQNQSYKAHARNWYQRNKSYFVKYRANPENKQREQGLVKARKEKETPEQHQRRLEQFRRSARKRREAIRAYRQRVKEHTAETKKLWRVNNLDRHAEHENQRRARKNGVPFEKVDRAAIIKRDGGICYLCSKTLKAREIHLDHVIPLSRGGTHTSANLRVACASCNYAKARYTLDEYLDLCANRLH